MGRRQIPAEVRQEAPAGWKVTDYVETKERSRAKHYGLGRTEGCGWPLRSAI